MAPHLVKRGRKIRASLDQFDVSVAPAARAQLLTERGIEPVELYERLRA